MILLDQVVEVLATPHLNVLPLRILPTQVPKGQMALLVAIKRNIAGHRGKHLESALRKNACAARRCDPDEAEIHRLAVPVDSAVEKVPLAANADIRLINAPGGIHGPCEAVPSLLELRHIANHPNDESSCATRQEGS